jgi:hypothetical protein
MDYSMFGAMLPQQAQEEDMRSRMVSPNTFAQLNPLQQIVALGGNAGAMVGGAVGNMMGGRTAKEAEGAMIKEVFDKASQMSEDPAEQYAFASREFRRLGMNDRAMALEDRVGTIKKAAVDLQEKQYKTQKEQADYAMRFAGLKSRDPTMSDDEARSIASNADLFKEKMKDPAAKFVTKNVDGQVKVYKETPQGLVFVNSLGVSDSKAPKVTVNLPKTSGDIIGFRKDLNAVVKPFRDAVNAADQAIVLADNAIKTGNFAAASSLARSLAKASGEEQLSREDVRAFGGDPSLVGSVSDAVSRLATGTVTNDTLRQLKSLAVILKNKNAGLERQELEKMQNLARASGRYTEAEINEVFDNRVRAPRREGGGGQTRTTKSGVKYTVED